MLVADPPRPPARQVAAERLGLARALERVTAAFLDQRVHLGEQLGLRCMQVEIFGPRP